MDTSQRISKDAMGWKKYEFPTTEMQEEENDKKIHLTETQATNTLIERLRNRIKICESVGRKTEARLWSSRLNKIEAKRMKNRLNQEFIDNFLLWLQGRSIYNTPKVSVVHLSGVDGDVNTEVKTKDGTPWGNTPLFHLPGVTEFLDQAFDRRGDTVKKISFLKNRGPRDLNEAYLYFKYIVMEMAIDENGIKEFESFRDYDYPISEGGEVLGPGQGLLPARFDFNLYNANLKNAIEVAQNAGTQIKLINELTQHWKLVPSNEKVDYEKKIEKVQDKITEKTAQLDLLDVDIRQDPARHHLDQEIEELLAHQEYARAKKKLARNAVNQLGWGGYMNERDAYQEYMRAMEIYVNSHKERVQLQEELENLQTDLVVLESTKFVTMANGDIAIQVHTEPDDYTISFSDFSPQDQEMVYLTFFLTHPDAIANDDPMEGVPKAETGVKEKVKVKGRVSTESKTLDAIKNLLQTLVTDFRQANWYQGNTDYSSYLASTKTNILNMNDAVQSNIKGENKFNVTGLVANNDLKEVTNMLKTEIIKEDKGVIFTDPTEPKPDSEIGKLIPAIDKLTKAVDNMPRTIGVIGKMDSDIVQNLEEVLAEGVDKFRKMFKDDDTYNKFFAGLNQAEIKLKLEEIFNNSKHEIEIGTVAENLGVSIKELDERLKGKQHITLDEDEIKKLSEGLGKIFENHIIKVNEENKLVRADFQDYTLKQLAAATEERNSIVNIQANQFKALKDEILGLRGDIQKLYVVEPRVKVNEDETVPLNKTEAKHAVDNDTPLNYDRPYSTEVRLTVRPDIDEQLKNYIRSELGISEDIDEISVNLQRFIDIKSKVVSQTNRYLTDFLHVTTGVRTIHVRPDELVEVRGQKIILDANEMIDLQQNKMKYTPLIELEQGSPIIIPVNRVKAQFNGITDLNITPQQVKTTFAGKLQIPLTANNFAVSGIIPITNLKFQAIKLSDLIISDGLKEKILGLYEPHFQQAGRVLGEYEKINNKMSEIGINLENIVKQRIALKQADDNLLTKAVNNINAKLHSLDQTLITLNQTVSNFKNGNFQNPVPQNLVQSGEPMAVDLQGMFTQLVGHQNELIAKMNNMTDVFSKLDKTESTAQLNSIVGQMQEYFPQFNNLLNNISLFTQGGSHNAGLALGYLNMLATSGELTKNSIGSMLSLLQDIDHKNVGFAGTHSELLRDLINVGKEGAMQQKLSNEFKKVSYTEQGRKKLADKEQELMREKETAEENKDREEVAKELSQLMDVLHERLLAESILEDARTLDYEIISKSELQKRRNPQEGEMEQQTDKQYINLWDEAGKLTPEVLNIERQLDDLIMNPLSGQNPNLPQQTAVAIVVDDQARGGGRYTTESKPAAHISTAERIALRKQNKTTMALLKGMIQQYGDTSDLNQRADKGNLLMPSDEGVGGLLGAFTSTVYSANPELLKRKTREVSGALTSLLLPGLTDEQYEKAEETLRIATQQTAKSALNTLIQGRRQGQFRDVLETFIQELTGATTEEELGEAVHKSKHHIEQYFTEIRQQIRNLKASDKPHGRQFTPRDVFAWKRGMHMISQNLTQKGEAGLASLKHTLETIQLMEKTNPQNVEKLSPNLRSGYTRGLWYKSVDDTLKDVFEKMDEAKTEISSIYNEAVPDIGAIGTKHEYEKGFGEFEQVYRDEIKKGEMVEYDEDYNETGEFQREQKVVIADIMRAIGTQDISSITNWEALRLPMHVWSFFRKYANTRPVRYIQTALKYLNRPEKTYAERTRRLIEKFVDNNDFNGLIKTITSVSSDADKTQAIGRLHSQYNTFFKGRITNDPNIINSINWTNVIQSHRLTTYNRTSLPPQEVIDEKDIKLVKRKMIIDSVLKKMEAMYEAEANKYPGFWNDIEVYNGSHRMVMASIGQKDNDPAVHMFTKLYLDAKRGPNSKFSHDAVLGSGEDTEDIYLDLSTEEFSVSAHKELWTEILESNKSMDNILFDANNLFEMVETRKQSDTALALTSYDANTFMTQKLETILRKTMPQDISKSMEAAIVQSLIEDRKITQRELAEEEAKHGINYAKIMAIKGQIWGNVNWSTRDKDDLDRILGEILTEIRNEFAASFPGFEEWAEKKYRELDPISVFRWSKEQSMAFKIMAKGLHSKENRNVLLKSFSLARYHGLKMT